MEKIFAPFETLLTTTVDRLGHWFSSVYPDALIWSVLGVAIVFVLRRQITALGLGATKRLLTRFSVTVSDEVDAQLHSAGEILVSAFAFYIAVQVLVPDGVAKIFLSQVLGSVAIIAVFGAWYRLSGSFASLLRNDPDSLVSSETDWIERITQFAVLLFGLTSLLKVWQVDISGALTGVGVLGAGLAIAAQDLIRNLVAGMTNISEKRFETGNAIAVDDQFIGTVKRIDLRSTLIVGFDQIPRHIPNSDLANAIVLNYSGLKRRRVYLKVPLILSSTRDQIEAVKNGLQEYHRSSGDFDLGEDAPKYICVGELGPSSVDILFYAWTNGPGYDELLQVTESLTLEILRITRAAGTTLAYPTQTLHLETVDVGEHRTSPGSETTP